MEKGYKRDWLTKAVYVGGIGLIIGGGIALAKGASGSWYYMAMGGITDGLAYLHDHWCQKQYENNLKNYPVNI